MVDGSKILSCTYVPKSDKIVIKAWSQEQLNWQLFCLQSPGSRSSNPFGHVGLKRTKFVNFLSKDLLLAKTDQHWSLFKDGLPQDLPPGLS